MAGWLRTNGVGVGDRVAAFLPNCPEAIVGMLATSSVGGNLVILQSRLRIPGGLGSLRDRFKPKVLIGCNGYSYGAPKRLTPATRYIRSLRLSRVGACGVGRLCGGPCSYWWRALGRHHAKWNSLTFEQLPFDHPLYIMYSSGTTGYRMYRSWCRRDAPAACEGTPPARGYDLRRRAVLPRPRAG